jgi:hypothetical protein
MSDEKRAPQTKRRYLSLAILALLVLTIVILVAAVCVVLWFPPEHSSAIGSIFGAAAGMLAVLWFSASLYYQSRQMKEQREQFLISFEHQSRQTEEQRKQFLENFKQLREDNRRNALTLVRDLLSRAEERALKSNPDLQSIDELQIQYVDVGQWKPILESVDPNTVLEVGKNWITTSEAPAIFLMRGIKNAAETYFRAIGDESIDYSMEPETFVCRYGQMLWKLPFFEEYAGIALLPEFMDRFTPGRAAMKLACTVAAYKRALSEGLENIWRKDKILEDIKKNKEAGYPMPAIAKDLE